MKLGLLGVGSILNRHLSVTRTLPGVEFRACASITREEAEQFAAKNQISLVFDTTEDLVKSSEIDTVYITTPHHLHYDMSMLALSHGKNVICEKPLALNAAMARRMKAYAKEHGLFLTEAMWTGFMPSRKVIDEAIASGILGNVTGLRCELAYPMTFIPRISNPKMGGGGLLDMGIYEVGFMLRHFGTDIASVKSEAVLMDSGCDAQFTAVYRYQDGRIATLINSVASLGENHTVIYGDKAYLEVDDITNPKRILVKGFGGKVVEELKLPEQRCGYEYEFIEFERCIREGKLEPETVRLDDSIKVLELMDQLRQEWGVVYPQELNFH